MTRLTPIAIAALALLAERPMHPYEMYQLLLDREGDRILKVRPGTLYHTVGRLNSGGLVRAVGVDREGNRPERTTFEVTERGRTELARCLTEMLTTPATEYAEFSLAISEAHNLPADQVLACLRARIKALRDDARELDARFAARDVSLIPRLFWINLDYDRAIRDAEVAWLEVVIRDIESGRLPWLDSAEVRAFAEAKGGVADGCRLEWNSEQNFVIPGG